MTSPLPVPPSNKAVNDIGHVADHNAITAALANDRVLAKATYRTNVVHGSTAATARPAGVPDGLIDWTGSVTPTNALDGDRWYDTAAELVKRRVAGGFVAAGSSTFIAATAATARFGKDRLISIARRSNPTTGFSNGTDTGGTARVQHILHPGVDASGIRLLYANITGPFGGPSVLTVRASVEFGGRTFQVTFNGQRTATMDPGAPYLLSDPLPIDVTFTPNQFIFTRTFVSVPTGGQFPVGLTLQGGTGEGNNYGTTTGADLTGSGYYNTPSSTFGAGTTAFSPVAILGTPNQPTASVLLVGDSILVGAGDDAGQPGYAVRRLNSFNIPHIQQARFGEQGASYNNTKIFRLAPTAYATHAIEGYGSNDYNPTGGTASLALLQSTMLAIWFSLARSGVKVYRVSILPRTSSTDGWATVANQTVGGNDAARVGFNDWLRNGAPINPSTLVAAATGAANDGSLRAGSVGHPLSGYFETADLVETARNSGMWQAPGFTTDGVHPTGNAHNLLGTAIDTAKFSVL